VLLRFAHRLAATVVPFATATLIASAAVAQTAIMVNEDLAMDDDLLTMLDTDPGHLLSGYEYPFFRSRLFSQTDTNRDGSISAQEFVAHAKAVFTAMDTDNDGFLAKDEIIVGHMNMLRMMYKNPHSPGTTELADAMLARSDTDHDGRISLEEYTVAIKQRFEAMDLNHDGTISRKEFETEHREHKG